eukprot:1231085-Prymnesium_polylepis.1
MGLRRAAARNSSVGRRRAGGRQLARARRSHPAARLIGERILPLLGPILARECEVVEVAVEAVDGDPLPHGGHMIGAVLDVDGDDGPLRT